MMRDSKRVFVIVNRVELHTVNFIMMRHFFNLCKKNKAVCAILVKI